MVTKQNQVAAFEILKKLANLFEMPAQIPKTEGKSFSCTSLATQTGFFKRDFHMYSYAVYIIWRTCQLALF